MADNLLPVEDVVRRPNPDPTEATIALVDNRIDGFRENVITRFESMDRAQRLFEENLTRVPTALQEAIRNQREYMEARIAELVAVDKHSAEQRMLLFTNITDAKDQLKILLQLEVKAVQSLVQSVLEGNKQLYMEKFTAIEETIKVLKDTVNDRFAQNDQNTEKAFNAAKQAVGERDASNAASSNKSEKNLMDALAKLDDNVKTLSGTTASQINSNKDNIDDKINDLKDQLARLDNRLSSGEGGKKGADQSVGWMFLGLGTLFGLIGAVGVMFSIALRH